jgi:cation:H+ antiporter
MLFEDLSPWLNGAIFLAAALVVWKAGSQLAQRADGIARKTGLGSALLGIFLLGGITSLPELAVGVSATLSGAPELSVNDVLGSAAINVVILAGADAVYGRKALTSTPATPEVLLQGTLGIVLLALVVGATLAGDVLVGGMGAWSWAILVAYLAALWIVSKSQGLHTWHPDRPAVPAPPPEHQQGQPQERSLRRLVAGAAVAGAVILVAGFLLAKTGEALAGQTGLGKSFFGAVLLAASTSLPEISTVLAAVRLRRYEMALSDVLGTNLFNVIILVLVDALHDGEPVLVMAGPFAAFGALLALVLTAIFLVGMLERRDRTVMRMGWDSLAALSCYAAGVVVLYQLR